MPNSDYRKILPQDLPENWDRIEEYHPKTQEIGDDFTLSDELALFVPSTIIKGEFNVLINPSKALEMELRMYLPDNQTPTGPAVSVTLSGSVLSVSVHN